MDSLIFIAVIFCLALVVFWYVQNVEAGARGEKGLLAVGEEKPALEAPGYRLKKRRAGPRHGLEKKNDAPAAYRQAGNSQSAFRAKEGAYRAKGPRVVKPEEN